MAVEAGDMSEVPFLPIVVNVLLYSTLPVSLILFVLGVQWLFRVFALLCAACLIGLIWFFAISSECCPTGMEALALVIWPSLLFVTGLWSWICYAVFFSLGLLPHQRS
ncbi:hypothetical protein AB1E33_25870 [Ruegeria sp. 2012CJ15-1]